jgi:protocatechuate 4,5-dioxygenase alpha chain
MALDKPYADVPGTTIFDADQARRGYHLNMFCMSLMKAPNRELPRDERAYLDEWLMTDQNSGVARDYSRMIELGGNTISCRSCSRRTARASSLRPAR